MTFLTSQATAAPCRYCSVASQANGEDPIGTAITANLWLMIEVPRPWAKDPWQKESTALQLLFKSLERWPRWWQQVRILAIAPDRHDSFPGYRHVICYRRPQGLFAQYWSDHYCVPTEFLPQLVKALLFQTSQLLEFERDRRLQHLVTGSKSLQSMPATLRPFDVVQEIF
mgnify:CR=1 FL=1